MSDERKFLHDVANPLGTAMFVMDSVLDDLKSHVNPDQDAILQLIQIQASLEKIKIILQKKAVFALSKELLELANENPGLVCLLTGSCKNSNLRQRTLDHVQRITCLCDGYCHGALNL